MISRNKIKYIHSLQMKKYRQQEQCFVAEGPKVVADLLELMPARLLVHTTGWTPGNETNGTETMLVSEDELRRVSFLQHPQDVLAVFPMPETDHVSPRTDRLSLALDNVQDPGNLGTIIRIADWFGIEDIFCSQGTADAYSPKVVQATMGSIARVHVRYVDLPQTISALPADFPVYAMMLEGEDIYRQSLTRHGLIVMGNEGQGISPAVRALVNRKLLIPNYPTDRPTADSLNVAVATAVTCAEFRRRLL